MNYFRNEYSLEQYYTNTNQQLISLRMNTDEIVKYCTNPIIKPHEKGEYFEWQLFNWLNLNGFTPTKSACRDQHGNIKGDNGIDLFANRLINNQKVKIVIQAKCYVSQRSIIREKVIKKLINCAEKYDAYGILFCYNLKNMDTESRNLIINTPNILMYDINTIDNFVNDLNNLIPMTHIKNDHLDLSQPIRSWIKIGSLDNIEQIGNLVIKGSGIRNLEYKSYQP